MVRVRKDSLIEVGDAAKAAVQRLEVRLQARQQRDRFRLLFGYRLCSRRHAKP